MIPMRQYEITKIEEDGKIEIPKEYIHELGALEGAYFLVGIDPDLKEANIERIAVEGKELVEMKAIVKDKPGVLAQISGILGEYKINILFNESQGVEEVELAAIIMIADISESEISLENLKEKILDNQEVEEITLETL